MSVFFSVVIPTYNRADILPVTIKSVLSQKYENWELLVVDDGSKDNTKEVVEAIDDPRVHYIYQENAERSAARNNGVDHAKGKYMCFLDSDDFYHEDYLAEMYKYLEKKNFPKELVIANLMLWYDENKEELKPMPEIGEDVAQWLFQNPITPTRICMDKAIFNDYRFRDDVIIVEDSVLWVSLANKYKVSLNRDAVAYYRYHPGNSTNLEFNSYGQRLRGLENFFRDKESNLLKQEYKNKLLSDCYFGIFKHHATHGRWFTARKVMIKAILKYPGIRLKEKVYLLLFPKKWNG